MITLIRFYQRYLSRWTPRCPQYESCSDYGIRMIHKHGVSRGLEMALERVQKCRTPVVCLIKDAVADRRGSDL